MITKNAIRLIEIIGQEYALHIRRAENKYIPTSKILACTIGGLTAKGKRDKDLRIFLDTIAYIHPHEDERMNLPWAKDPREPDPVTGVRPEREQRTRDDDIGLVPADVQRITGSLK